MLRFAKTFMRSSIGALIGTAALELGAPEVAAPGAEAFPEGFEAGAPGLADPSELAMLLELPEPLR
jgi:hypothetical protein